MGGIGGSGITEKCKGACSLKYKWTEIQNSGERVREKERDRESEREIERGAPERRNTVYL